jgi:hypothetical protein
MGKRRLSAITITAFALAVVCGTTWAGLEFPFTTATQAEYMAGETAVILGYEFQPGQELMVRITRPDGEIINAKGRKHQADIVTVDSWGQFSYSYPQLDQEGSYFVDIIDASTVGKGKDKLNGTVLATSRFRDNITTDLELVGMPDAQCGANRPPAHGSSPPTPSHGHDGLVDALAGKCLVGTVDVTATGNDDDVRGFYFDLDIDIESFHQGPGNALEPFIDWLEWIGIRNTADPDVGSSQADDGTGGCASDCYYTTTGFTGAGMIPNDGTTASWQSLDGTWFSIQRSGSGNMAGEDRYRITVDPAMNPQITSARFEYCARINPNAGDEDLGTDGFITSDPETGGTEASPINVCRIEDQTAPICNLLFVDCGVDVHVIDPEGGVQRITVMAADNVDIDLDNPTMSLGMADVVNYAPSETGDINLDVDKTICDDPGWVEFEIMNSTGLITVCDPVDFALIRGNGPPSTHSFPLNDREGFLRIENEGLREIFIEMNGNKLHFSINKGVGANAYGMLEDGISEYDLTEFLVPGDNAVDIRAVGPPSGRARIVIHD